MKLSQRLKKASKETHSISNALVAARLVALFTDRALYGRGLGCFYHVHAELERCLDAAASRDALVKELAPVVRPLYRAAAFERDLAFFLGPDWRAQVGPSPQVGAYLLHLRRLGEEAPALLLAHSYTQHLALLLGGQMVARAARRGMGLPEGAGTSTFDYAQPIGELKTAYLGAFDGLEAHLTGEQVEELVREHLEAFRLNNDILKAFRLGYLAPLRAAAKLAPRVALGLAALLAALLAAVLWRCLGQQLLALRHAGLYNKMRTL